MSTPTDSFSALRAAVAEETETAKADGRALTSLRRALEALADAERAHFTARRAHLAAIDRVANAEARMQDDAREAACPWTGATSRQ